MITPNGRSKALLDKVYDHLDSIDVTKLSMGELQDFLVVVQKGQFLETIGQPSPWFNGFGGALSRPAASANEIPGNGGGNKE